MNHVLAHINDRLARGESIDENSSTITLDRKYNTYLRFATSKHKYPQDALAMIVKIFRVHFQGFEKSSILQTTSTH